MGDNTRMYINPDVKVGIHPLYSNESNNTMFTICCNTAICDDQACCPACGREVIGSEIENSVDRGRYRWNMVYRRDRTR